MKWVYFPMFDHHIAVSEHVAGELTDAARGHKVCRGIWVSPMGVDCGQFSPSRRSPEKRRELIEALGGNGNETILLYVGRLVPEKNLPLLLNTVSHLDRNAFRLAIVGAGVLQESLHAECLRRGLSNIVFTGQLSDRDRLADYYANADIFVHPNAREPFGIAPLEAMASGLPLVAPNEGGVTTYASQENAWLCAPDPKDFATNICRIADNQEERARKAWEGRHTAESYSWERATSRFLDLYEDIHALTQGIGCQPRHKPHTYSTPGDAFGREIVRSKSFKTV
jgi:glycosyltransferase involved in cell wall biosynthesis